MVGVTPCKGRRPVTKSSRILQLNDAKGANTKDISVALALRGRVHTAVAADTGIPTTNGTSNVLIDPTAAPDGFLVGLSFDFRVTQPGRFKFVRNVTESTPGAAVPFFNRNLNSETAALSAVRQNSVWSGGTTVFDIVTIGGDSDKEFPLIPVLPLTWVLDRSELYVLQYTNQDAAEAADSNITVNVSEPAELP